MIYTMWHCMHAVYWTCNLHVCETISWNADGILWHVHILWFPLWHYHLHNVNVSINVWMFQEMFSPPSFPRFPCQYLPPHLRSPSLATNLYLKYIFIFGGTKSVMKSIFSYHAIWMSDDDQWCISMFCHVFLGQ